MFATVYAKYGLARPDIIGEATNVAELKKRLSDGTPILSHYRSLSYADYSHLSSLWTSAFPAHLPHALIDEKVSIAASAITGNAAERKSLTSAFGIVRVSLFRERGWLPTYAIRTAHAVLYAQRWPFPGTPGYFRTGHASPAAGVLSAHVLEIEAAVEKLVGAFNDRCRAFPNQSLDAAVCAVQFYVGFLRVYPFPGGNERVGRAVMWALLARKGLPPPLLVGDGQRGWEAGLENETDFFEEQIVGIVRNA
jgi:fido (protein-threonine AMPylation protein)